MPVVQGPFGSLQDTDKLRAFLELNEFINEFKARHRGIEFRGSPGNERNAEHTYQVEFLALTLNAELGLGFDMLELIIEAKCHDLVEYLEGDTPMFPETFRGEPPPDPVMKRVKEERAFSELNRRFGSRFPWMIKAIRAYLDQKDEKSWFIHALGKLVAVTNIYQDQGRSWRNRGIPIQVAYEYHREGAWRHPVVKKLYEQVWDLIRKDAAQNPNLYPHEIVQHEANQRRSE